MTESTAQTAASLPSDDASYKEQIRLQRDRILLKNFGTAMRAGLLNAVILCALFTQYATFWKLGLWFAIVTSASLVRWRLSTILLQRNTIIGARDMRIFLVLTIISGVGWGVAPSLLNAEASIGALSLSVFLIAGMTAAAGLSFSSHTHVVMAFNGPALAMLAVYYITHPGVEEIAMALVLVFYYAAIRQLTRRSNRTLIKALTNEAMAEAQKKRIESQKTAFAALAQNYREAADQAKSADMTKSVFIANMSHEIRTPMNGVIGMLTALEQTSLTPEQKRFAGIAQKSANGLLMMINDVLDLSKIESGKMTLSRVEFSLRETLEVIVESLRHNTAAKGLQLQVTVDEELPRAMIGDETRLRQVLFNLTGNAVKFTDSGKVEIAVKSAGMGEDGRIALAFSVRDTGIGISEKDIDRLFNRFERATSERVRETSGAGLGLAIASELVTLMGGKLKCESIVNEGSTFSFNVVVKTQEDARADRAAELNEARAASSAKFDLKLLVAEDNIVNRQVILALLEKTGVEIVFAVNGREAVEQATSSPYDAVLMDVHMPVMGGAEAAAAIRKSGLGPDRLPIFAATADADFGASPEFDAAHMNGVIYKPFRFEDLVDALKNIADVKAEEDAA